MSTTTTTTTTTPWRAVPDGPRGIIAEMVGRRSVESLDAAEAFRDLGLAAALEIKATEGLRRGVLKADGAGEEAGAGLWRQRVVRALGTQDACSKVVLWASDELLVSLIGKALGMNNQNWHELEVRGSSGLLPILGGLQANHTLRSFQAYAPWSDIAHLCLDDCAALGQALRAESCALRKLCLGVATILEPGAAAGLFADMAQNCTLRELCLQVRVHDGDSAQVAAALGDMLRTQHAPLEVLSLDNNRQWLGEAGSALLAQGLVGNGVLRDLSLDMCGIGPAAATALGAALGFKHSALQRLNLHGNVDIGDDDGAALAAGLARNRVLREMYLSRCNVGAATATAIGVALSFKHSRLQTLHLGANLNIGDSGGAALARGLRRNAVLRELSLARCNLGPAAAASLGEALRNEGTVLRVLQLSDNPCIGDAGGAALAAGLARNRSLRELCLVKCGLGPAAASALGAALRFEGSALEWLFLGQNSSIGDAGGVSLARGCVRNCALRGLSLARCELGPATASTLADALRFEQSALEKLSLLGNDAIGDDGGAALGNALSHNSVLRELNLSKCGLGPAAAAALGAALSFEHSALATVDAVLNESLGDAGVATLVGGLARNKALRVLVLAGCSLGQKATAALDKVLRYEHSALMFLGLDDCGIDQAAAERMRAAARTEGFQLRV